MFLACIQCCSSTVDTHPKRKLYCLWKRKIILLLLIFRQLYNIILGASHLRYKYDVRFNKEPNFRGTIKLSKARHFLKHKSGEWVVVGYQHDTIFNSHRLGIHVNFESYQTVLLCITKITKKMLYRALPSSLLTAVNANWNNPVGDHNNRDKKL